MQKQSEILSQIIQDSSITDKEALDKCSLEDRIFRGAELIREAYERVINTG